MEKMFLATHDSPPLAEAGLHCLCASLNTPVINIEDMRVGPARAAIVVYADDRGGLGLAVGLRSLKNGQVRVFAFQGDLDPAATGSELMEGALSFAEGMGFLFDDDMIASAGPGGQVRALRHWEELVGGITPAEEQRPSADAGETETFGLSGAMGAYAESDEDLGETDELLLEELVPGEGELEDDGEDLEEFVLGDEFADETRLLGDPPDGLLDEAAEELSVDDEVPAASGQVPLSKFRRVTVIEAAQAPEEDAELGPSELGRIPLVRMRLEGNGAERPDPLSRLLASF